MSGTTQYERKAVPLKDQTIEQLHALEVRILEETGDRLAPIHAELDSRARRAVAVDPEGPKWFWAIERVFSTIDCIRHRPIVPGVKLWRQGDPISDAPTAEAAETAHRRRLVQFAREVSEWLKDNPRSAFRFDRWLRELAAWAMRAPSDVAHGRLNWTPTPELPYPDRLRGR